MFSDETRYLAIDFGLKRIGLALTDPLKTFSYPFETINNDNNTINKIGKIILEKKIIKIIIGMPYKESGDIGSLSNKIYEFSNQLKKISDIEILFRDERYSSAIAKERIINSVTKKSARRNKGLIDSNAAAVFLEEYLAEEEEIKKI